MGCTQDAFRVFLPAYSPNFMKQETRLQRKIQEALKEEFGADIWVVKFHGNPFVPVGVPDLIICYLGKFIALEVKRPETVSDVSPMQAKTIKKIIRANGHATVVTSAEQAIAEVREA